MIAAEHEEVVGVFDLIGHHQTDAFEWLPAPIYVITEE